MVVFALGVVLDIQRAGAAGFGVRPLRHHMPASSSATAVTPAITSNAA